MIEPDPPSHLSAPTSLAAPEHSELPAEARQAFVEVDRKCRMFIFPQLRQLGGEAAVERLTQEAQLLAEAAAEGAHDGLAGRYQDLLAQAQAALREARTAEVHQESELRQHRRAEGQLEAGLLAAKAQLPAARMARLQQKLDEMAEAGSGGDRAALAEAAVAEWERLSQVRQAREAERLADRAHAPIQARKQPTSRSRRALRDQALVVELARSFGQGASDSGPVPVPDPSDQ
ncbi:MAG: hypothetical protein ABSF27_05495 [Candidatus Dormibacteria bacterium]